MPNYWGRNANPATRGWAPKTPSVGAPTPAGGPPAIPGVKPPGQARIGATSRKTAFAEGGTPTWKDQGWKDEKSYNAWLDKADQAKAAGVVPTYRPADWKDTSDQTRTAAFDPTRDWRYDKPPPASTFVDVMGRVDPVKYQQYMSSPERFAAAQAVPARPQVKSSPVTKLSSNAAVTKKINDMIGPPREPPLTSASDWGGTPAPPDAYYYGSLYRPPAPEPGPFPPRPEFVPPAINAEQQHYPELGPEFRRPPLPPGLPQGDPNFAIENGPLFQGPGLNMGYTPSELYAMQHPGSPYGNRRFGGARFGASRAMGGPIGFARGGGTAPGFIPATAGPLWQNQLMGAVGPGHPALPFSRAVGPDVGGSANAATGSGGDAAGGVSGSGGIGGSATSGQGGSAAAGTVGSAAEGVGGGDAGSGTYAWGGPIGYAKGGDTLDSDMTADPSGDSGFIPATAFGDAAANIGPSQAVTGQPIEGPRLGGGGGGSGGGGGGGMGDALGAIGSIAKLGMTIAPMFSDRRGKTDVQKLDRRGGQQMYAYRYKGDPKNYPKVVGPMADELPRGAAYEMKKGYAEGGSIYERLMAQGEQDPRSPNISAGEQRYLQALEMLRHHAGGGQSADDAWEQMAQGLRGRGGVGDSTRPTYYLPSMREIPGSRRPIEGGDWEQMLQGLQGRGGPEQGMARGGYPDFFNAPPLPVPGLPQRTAFKGAGYVGSDGQGDGRSDHIDAALSPGEFVMDAETTSLLGDGDNTAGARKLEQLRQNVRRHKGSQLAKGKFSAKAKAPEQYMSSKSSAADQLAHSGISDGLRGRR